MTQISITSAMTDNSPIRYKVWLYDGNSVIMQGYGQTLELGLGQSKDIVVVFY